MGAVSLDAEWQSPVCIGIDVGQIADPTAIAVAEAVEKGTGKFRYNSERIPAHVDETGWFHKPHDADEVMATHYNIRHIQRLPLGTSYPAVAVHIADMLCNTIFVHRHVRVLIDVTGVGRPVYEDVQKEISLRPEARLILVRPISFVHGEKYNRSLGTLGKAYLVSRLQSLLQGGTVHAPDTPEVKVMLEELKVYQIKVDLDGNDTYGAMRVGEHDDLATALALACLEDPFADRVKYSRRLY